MHHIHGGVGGVVVWGWGWYGGVVVWVRVLVLWVWWCKGCVGVCVWGWVVLCVWEWDGSGV
jgi:hypothetical protein